MTSHVQPQHRGSRRSLQYVLFAGTGIGCALPGVLLPLLQPKWHLHDQQAGLAFFLSWIGSSSGALLVRGSLRRTVILGGMLVFIGSWGLTGLAEGWFSVWMAFYGMGMGLTMTSISLVRQQNSEERELVRLNFVWAIGSVASPWLTVHALRVNNASRILAAFGVVFLAIALWTAAGVTTSTRPAAASASRSWLSAFKLLPVSLAVMVAFSTGIEASAGAWLATYASRLQHNLQFILGAPTCLWTGILLSRLLWSLPSLKASPRLIVQGSLSLVAISAVALVASENLVAILLAALGIGIGLGPIYPLLLARALLYDESGNIFFLAGLGSGFLPWMTGALSQWSSTLRGGLLVPAAAAIIALSLSLFANPREPASAFHPN